MPEVAEVHAFQEYIRDCIQALPPADLRITALWSDAKLAERGPMKERQEALMAFSATLSKTSTQSERVKWSSEIFKRVKAIPDTHGTLIGEVWKLLPENLQVQLCPNHSSWQAFLYAFEALKDGEVTVPDTFPHPAFKQNPELPNIDILPGTRSSSTTPDSPLTPLPDSFNDMDEIPALDLDSPLTPFPDSFNNMDEIPALDLDPTNSSSANTTIYDTTSGQTGHVGQASGSGSQGPSRTTQSGSGAGPSQTPPERMTHDGGTGCGGNGRGNAGAGNGSAGAGAGAGAGNGSAGAGNRSAGAGNGSAGAGNGSAGAGAGRAGGIGKRGSMAREESQKKRLKTTNDPDTNGRPSTSAYIYGGSRG
ncbi:hypothetical protein C8R44DRAFT_731477 [Mycena epipterygia]|nr:hypothetical protein C8R44DRAFT_731477 [Mycena epipterygia]